MGILLLFFDGVGIAPPDTKANPITEFINRPFPVGNHEYDFHEGILVPTDATLGIDGLPQSATGQTTILTGVNAAAIEGRHVTAYPTTKLRRLITDQSLLKTIKEAGATPTFANAYHPDYFRRKHTRYSVSTWAWLAAGIDYLTIDDLRQGTAVSHDITNEFMHRYGYAVPIREPEETGQILANMLDKYDFVFFEYILTDRCGHRQDMAEAVVRLGQIAGLMTKLLQAADLGESTVMLTSDHGNLEDLSVKTHTLNPVPTILWGRHARMMAEQIRSIQDIAPVVLQEIGVDRDMNPGKSYSIS